MTNKPLYGIVRNGKAIGVPREEYDAYVQEMQDKAWAKLIASSVAI